MPVEEGTGAMPNYKTGPLDILTYLLGGGDGGATAQDYRPGLMGTAIVEKVADAPTGAVIGPWAPALAALFGGDF